MYLINLKTGQSVSLHPKDHKENDKFFFDFRPGEDAKDDGSDRGSESLLSSSSCSESESDSDSEQKSNGRTFEQIMSQQKATTALPSQQSNELNILSKKQKDENRSNSKIPSARQKYFSYKSLQ